MIRFSGKRNIPLFAIALATIQGIAGTQPSRAGDFKGVLRVEATLGDSTAYFKVGDAGGRPVILHHSNQSPERKVEINLKDRDFFVSKAEEILEALKNEPPVRDSSACPRENAVIEVQKSLKESRKGILCIRSASKASKTLLRLIDVLGADFL